MDWLALVIGLCGTSGGLFEFFRTRRNGNQVMVVQRDQNRYGRYLTMSEYGHDKRHGSIVVPESLKGEGWRKFGALLMEVFYPYSVLGDRNRTHYKIGTSS
ncbi:hypothetical protein I3842_05G160400 [Carya illinoinensis]|uniref:Uncharacterized protein n=1 Tax=Carya illinoinensis TaxID=32201 RepID=A0A922F0E0_CARIL|nr:hypothetical protein I3842_05G160400 [Carya illinoinensis]